eukprot:6214780-Pleurochrysis_carterae.AAC.2
MMAVSSFRASSTRSGLLCIHASKPGGSGGLSSDRRPRSSERLSVLVRTRPKRAESIARSQR